MSGIENIIEVNPLSNRISFRLSQAAQVGLCTSMLIFQHSAFISGGAAVAAFLWAMKSNNMNTKFASVFPATPENEITGESVDLPKDLRSFSERLHLPVVPQLHVFNFDKIKDAKKNSLLGCDMSKLETKEEKAAYFDERQREYSQRSYARMTGGRADAGTLGQAEPVIIITRLNEAGLSKKEQASIAGHELGHFAAGDFQKSITSNALNGFIVISALAGAAGSVWNFVHGTSSGQDVLINFGVLASILTAARVVDREYKKTREYQADRIAAELTSPEVFAAALKKGSAYNPVGANTSLKWKVFHLATFLFVDGHPSMEKRLARLEKMSRRQDAAAVPYIN